MCLCVVWVSVVHVCRDVCRDVLCMWMCVSHVCAACVRMCV